MNRDQIMRPESMPAEYLVAISCIILFTSMVVPNLALQYQYDIEISYVRSFFGDWPWTVWGLVGLNEFSTDQFWREIHTQLIEWAQLPDSAYQVRWEQIVQQALDNMILLAYRKPNGQRKSSREILVCCTVLVNYSSPSGSVGPIFYFTCVAFSF